jgi:hypothetical protein
VLGLYGIRLRMLFKPPEGGFFYWRNESLEPRNEMDLGRVGISGL